MAERLGMSLDEIIADRSKKQREKKAKAVKSNQPGGTKFKRGATDKAGSRHDGAASHVASNRVLKVVTVERPKVVKPSEDTTYISQKSSVFDRLAIPGADVKFQNLRMSVTERDIRELCEAVGRVKHVAMEVGGRGVQSAAVSFFRDQDAQKCITKYNGLALDGAPMRVVLDSKEATATVPSVESNVTTAMSEQIQYPTGENVRQGLFGTALGDRTVSRVVVSRSANASEPRGNARAQPKTAKAGGRQPGAASSGKQVKASDLDNDLDDYMAQR